MKCLSEDLTGSFEVDDFREAYPDWFLSLGMAEQNIIGFFVQAEDGIRAFHVTGVQTCALPICRWPSVSEASQRTAGREGRRPTRWPSTSALASCGTRAAARVRIDFAVQRSGVRVQSPVWEMPPTTTSSLRGTTYMRSFGPRSAISHSRSPGWRTQTIWPRTGTRLSSPAIQRAPSPVQLTTTSAEFGSA